MLNNLTIHVMNLNTRIIDLTLGELLDEIDKRHSSSQECQVKADADSYIRGLNGIADVLGVSIATVCKYRKEGWIEPAIHQNGRTIIANKERLIQLFKEHSN
jgi:uncharacterized protein (DUF885 family)